MPIERNEGTLSILQNNKLLFLYRNNILLSGTTLMPDSFTASQQFTWPHVGIGRATMLLWGEKDVKPISALDIDLGVGVWRGCVTDNTTFWFVEGNDARAYVASTMTRNAEFDIENIPGSSGATNYWYAGITDGITMWFVNLYVLGTTLSTRARAYTLSTRERNAAFDIFLGNSFFRPGFFDGTNLYFTSGTSARAWTASTRSRNSDMDFNLEHGNIAEGATDGITAWLLSRDSDHLDAYMVSTKARVPELDIRVGGDIWTGVLYYNKVFYAVKNENDLANAFSKPQAKVTTNNVTYVSDDNDRNVKVEILSGLTPSTEFDIAIQDNALAEFYPHIY